MPPHKTPMERLFLTQRKAGLGSLGGTLENYGPQQRSTSPLQVVPSGIFAWGTVGSLPPLAVDSFDGLIWLDTGVSPNVIRMFDGSLYQPGNIAPRTGAAGLSLVSGGRLLHDTFTGLSAGSNLSTHVPDVVGGATVTYSDGPAGTVVGGSGGGSIVPGSSSGGATRHNVIGLINGISDSADYVILMVHTYVPPNGGAPRDMGVAHQYVDANNFETFSIRSAFGGSASQQYGNQKIASGADSTATVAVNQTTLATDICELIVAGTSTLTVKRNGGTVASGTVTGTGGSGFGFSCYNNVIADTPRIDELVICRGRVLSIQGVRAGSGWAARIYDSVGATITSGTESGGQIDLDISTYAGLGIGGITGHIELFTDNTFATPVTDGRYPTAGNATSIYPGDVFQWAF